MRVAFFGLFLTAAAVFAADPIPLPEHPRPDFERPEWVNLNGSWSFRFDKSDEGVKQQWFTQDNGQYPLVVTVPFPWGSKASGVKDEADIGWYRRTVTLPERWKGMRVFLVVGASDWQTHGWIDGQAIGEHHGGYTPFEFELTPFAKWGEPQQITLRADDKRRDFTLYGKQGYGNARGIWQTVYLEARPATYLESVHLVPDIDRRMVTAKITLSGPAKDDLSFSLRFKPEDRSAEAKAEFQIGQMELTLPVPLRDVKLWDLDNPYLYEVKAVLEGTGIKDEVSTYFGMRKISVAKLPGSGIPYIALNNKPVYMQLTLDQSYHPDGYYTFPSDEFMKNEILISKRLGLTGNRIHIKVEIPRKLYWADKLGLLIMADVPNSWGQPTQEMFQESEYALREMVRRDMNHPAIFCWVLYNETWGLFTKVPGKPNQYLPQTQEKVAAMYRLAKQLDPSRLVEDQSPCHNDHVVSDLNSWHAYRPGYQWEKEVLDAVKNTFPGSKWNYKDGYRQTDGVPMLNSECGNVWGYEGSSGDCDWSWDYHMMMDAFRRHPQCCGWLYTEHHDVCNEWNGYVRFDRTEKFTGIEELFPGMRLNDLHSDAYLALDTELFRVFRPGDTWRMPVSLSLTTDRFEGKPLTLNAEIRMWDSQGKLSEQPIKNLCPAFAAKAWDSRELGPLNIKLPDRVGAGVICLSLVDDRKIVARNFATFALRDGEQQPRQQTTDGGVTVRVAPKSFVRAEWSQKQWNVLDGLKVNGAGKGFFEYTVAVPQGQWSKAVLRAEISAKRLNGKDKEGAKGDSDGDYMLGAGFHDRSANKNAYPMTSVDKWKGAVRIVVNGETVKTVELADDPADHRGFLSWGSQLRDKLLREAGSYGYLVETEIPAAVLAKAADGKITVRFEADDKGLAIYGERFGRYPMDITFDFVK